MAGDGITTARRIIWERSDGDGFNVLSAAPDSEQWHWALLNGNFGNRAQVERYVANCTGPETLVIERSGRIHDSVLPDEWITPETEVHYGGARIWRPQTEGVA